MMKSVECSFEKKFYNYVYIYIFMQTGSFAVSISYKNMHALMSINVYSIESPSKPIIDVGKALQFQFEF